MKSLDRLQPLIDHLRQVQQIDSAAAVLAWDQETYMPAGGGEARAEQMATLGDLAHRKRVGRTMKSLLSRHLDLETGHFDENEWEGEAAALLREVWRDYRDAVRLPARFVREATRVEAIGQQVWATARAHNDFAAFLPHLKKIVQLKKREARYLREGATGSLYDLLLDQYEPGMTTARLMPIFERLTTALSPLLRQITEAAHPPDDTFLRGDYPAEKQTAFGREILQAIGYDFDRGRQDISAHPFTTSFHPDDVRITTRIDPNDLVSSLFSSIHEGGHALYDQALPVAHFGTPLGEALSMGIHESQSRLWENGVARSLPFWRHFYPRLQNAFPEPLRHIDAERFYRAINVVRPSLIRVEADELTYPFHIQVRFEIERALIDDDLPVEALPTVWNEAMKRHLGVVPPTDAEGVLQDIHWSGGDFGYFPAYVLGNLYAAQWLRQIEKEVPTVWDDIGGGNLQPIRRWLNEKIHRMGRRYPPGELVLRLTGEPLNPDPFIESLTAKLKAVYQLN